MAVNMGLEKKGEGLRELREREKWGRGRWIANSHKPSVNQGGLQSKIQIVPMNLRSEVKRRQKPTTKKKSPGLLNAVAFWKRRE